MLEYFIFFLIIIIFGIVPSIYYIKNYSEIEEKNKEKRQINKKIVYLTIILMLLNLIYLFIFENTNDLETFIALPILIIILGGFIELELIVYIFLIYNLVMSFLYLKNLF